MGTLDRHARQSASLKKHGHASVEQGKKKPSPTYNTWNMMLERVLNPNATGYKNYGGRGIDVCDRWLLFENFLADMGERPEGMSINRIDNDGNYEPGNCEWAPVKTQTGINQRRRPINKYGFRYGGS